MGSQTSPLVRRSSAPSTSLTQKSKVFADVVDRNESASTSRHDTIAASPEGATSSFSAHDDAGDVCDRVDMTSTTPETRR